MSLDSDLLAENAAEYGVKNGGLSAGECAFTLNGIADSESETSGTGETTEEVAGGSMSDTVNHPPHYTFSQIEVIDAIEVWKLNYHLGNVVKYVARAQHKGNYLQDLKKARWYLQREIERMEKTEKPL